MASVVDAGVISDSLSDKLARLNAAFLAEFGTGPDGIDTSPQSYTGRQNPIIARALVDNEQLLIEILSMMNRLSAQGRFQDFIGTLLDEDRNEARSATIPALVYGVAGFNAGDRRVRYRRNSTIWRIPEGTLISANGQIAVDLVSDVSGTELTDGTLIQAWQDGTDQWIVVDQDPANLTGVESTADYSPGTDTEGDPSYKTRLGLAGRSSGVGTEPGIQRAITRVAGVGAKVDNNRDLFPNANGVPGKSIESVVEEGTDAAVAQAVLDSYSDTAGFYGTTTATAFDFNGNPVEVQFTRVERIDIAWAVTINTAGAETPLPDDPDDLAQTALADYTNGLVTGLDVVPDEGDAAVREAFPDGSIPQGGLTLTVGLKGGPLSGTTVPITSRQRARTNPEQQPAEVVGTTTQTFDIIAGQLIMLSVDDGVAQAVTLVLSDFTIISQATALEIATAIINRTTGVVAGSEQGALVLGSETVGSGSSIEILAGSTAALLATLGLNFGIVFGNDGDITVTTI